MCSFVVLVFVLYDQVLTSCTSIFYEDSLGLFHQIRVLRICELNSLLISMFLYYNDHKSRIMHLLVMVPFELWLDSIYQDNADYISTSMFCLNSLI